MNRKDYTTSVENGMRVKHDAKARVTVKTGNKILEDDFHDAESLGGAFTVISFKYNRASMSGGVDWWNPSNGYPINRPKIHVRFRPEDILTGDQECDCPACTATPSN